MPRYRPTSWRAYEPERARTRAPTAVSGCRILGLDPGSQRTGFGIVACEGVDYVHIAHGCINVAGLDFAVRLRRIFEAVGKLIETHRPDEIAIERVFVSRNPDSALKLGQARGAALSAVRESLRVFEYAPREVKLAVAGFGAADKSQVTHMILQLLRIDGAVPADASDALAVAVCHVHARRLRAYIESRQVAGQ